MSKYQSLWQFLSNCGKEKHKLTFENIREILGFEIDHSFLTYKREALDYGLEVSKISLKEKYVIFVKKH